MNQKRKRDGEAVGAEENGAAALMAEMKAALDRNTSHMTQMQNKCQSMQNEIDGMKMRLYHMDELEDKCNYLELRCGSLERTLHSVAKNGHWTYSAPDIPSSYWEEHFDEFEAEAMAYITDIIKHVTCSLRGDDGEFGVFLNMADAPVEFLRHHDVLLPHWQELADALQLCQQPDNNPYALFSITDIQLVPKVLDMLEYSLRGKTLTNFCFRDNHFEGENDGIDFVLKLLKQNPGLTKFIWSNNPIHSQRDAENLADALSRLSHPEHIEIKGCCDGDDVDGYELLCNCIEGNKHVKHLKFDSNNICTEGDTRLFDFIATDPLLESLGLHGNYLFDNDALMLSEALRKNSTLKSLGVGFSAITDIGCVGFAEALAVNSTLCYLRLPRNTMITSAGCNALEKAIFDRSSLNKVADSNHQCELVGINVPCWNCGSASKSSNRRRKIFQVLSDRNKTGSNVYHLNTEMGDEESLKLVPKVLEIPALRLDRGCRPKSLSIMYELLRNWKMPSLYEAHSK